MRSADFDFSRMPQGLAELIGRADSTGRAPPPVEKWDPPFCGDLDMRIASDGSWHYLGSPIGRAPLVRLFGSILRKDEDGRYYLVTPVEKVGITVEDAPFLAVELHAQGKRDTQLITFRTNVGDVVVADADHPFRFATDPDNAGLKPYVLVRGRLEALLARPLLYQLADLFEEHDRGEGPETGVWSGGRFFALPPECLSPKT